MEQTIIGKLSAVLNTLNAISVSGKQNLMRLSGSIDVLEGVLEELQSDPRDAER